jgi:hypothetical protein
MKRNLCLVLGFALLAVTRLGCESGDVLRDGNGDADVDTDGDGDSDSDTGSVCDEQNFEIERVPVRLMILQDMSYSMSDPEVANPTHWTHARPALIALLINWTGQGIEFGFDIFPDSNQAFYGCHVTAPIQIDAALDNEQQIIGFIEGYTPYGESTPLWCAMDNFTEPGYAPLFTADGGQPYLLVVSDGEDLCGTGCQIGGAASAGEMGMVTAQLLGNGIKTFVIGFGSGVSAAQLNAIAQNGGTPFTTYFNAQNGEQLQEALETVAASVVSCVWDIEEPAATADPDNVNFYFDDEVVPYDENCEMGIGWTWTDESHTQVEFCDGACDQLVAGGVDEISAMFGCPTVVIE